MFLKWFSYNLCCVVGCIDMLKDVNVFINDCCHGSCTNGGIQKHSTWMMESSVSKQNVTQNILLLITYFPTMYPSATISQGYFTSICTQSSMLVKRKQETWNQANFFYWYKIQFQCLCAYWRCFQEWTLVSIGNTSSYKADQYS